MRPRDGTTATAIAGTGWLLLFGQRPLQPAGSRNRHLAQARRTTYKRLRDCCRADVCLRSPHFRRIFRFAPLNCETFGCIDGFQPVRSTNQLRPWRLRKRPPGLYPLPRRPGCNRSWAACRSSSLRWNRRTPLHSLATDWVKPRRAISLSIRGLGKAKRKKKQHRSDKVAHVGIGSKHPNPDDEESVLLEVGLSAVCIYLYAASCFIILAGLCSRLLGYIECGATPDTGLSFPGPSTRYYPGRTLIEVCKRDCTITSATICAFP